MKHLRTPKIGFGILITLALVLSVQGTADALTFNTSRTGDLQTVFANQEIRITFSPRLQGNTHITHTNGKRITQSWSATDGAPSSGLTAATGTQYYVDSTGYVLNDEDGFRVNAAGTAIDTSGYQLNADGNRVHAASGGTAIDASGFKLNADGTRETTQGTQATYYTLVDSGGTERSVDSQRYEVDTTTGQRVTPATRYAAATQFKPDDTDQVKVPDEFRYHYSSEAIQVDIEDSTGANDGPANITRVGTHTVPASAAKTLMMYESTHPSYNTAAAYEKLSGSVSLTLAPTGTGVIEIIISDDTPTDDAPTNGKSQPITFTIYVVDYSLSVSTSALSFNNLRADNYAYVNDQFDPQIAFTVTSTPAGDNAPVKVKVVEGPGRLYVRKTYTGTTPTNGSPASEGRAGKELDISAQVATGGDTGANVYLDVGGGTNRITITAPGHDPVTAIYVYGRPSVEIVSGNSKIGATNGRLEDPLVVRVKDEKNKGIPMAVVIFGSGNTTDADERFLPVPGTTVHVDAVTTGKPVPDWASSFTDIDDINAPATATSLYPMTNDDTATDVDDDVVVQTDRNGEAQVYFQLGGTVGAQNITASSVGESARFTVTAIDAGRSASLVLVSGDNQRSDATTHDVTDPLVVRVRRPGGYRISGVRIRFTALTGALGAAPGRSAVAGPGSTTITTSGQEIFIDTDAHGEASVIYNAGQIAGAKTVTARVDDEEATTQYDFQIRQVEFAIDGTGSQQPQPPQQPQQPQPPAARTITVSPLRIEGPPNSQHEITITSSEAIRVGDPLLGQFLRAGGSASPPIASGSGTFTSTLTLPDTEGTRNLLVSTVSGSGSETVIVTVRGAASAPQTGGTLTVRVDPFSDVPGTTATVTVTATDSNNQPADVTVSLSATGGSLSRSSVSTGTDGTDNTITITRGSTVGTENYVTVNGPSGYDSVRSRFVISGAQQPPTGGGGSSQVAGEPASLSAYEGNNQEGSPNIRLLSPLVVEVVDANDNPVPNVRVRFRTTIGSGTFTPRTSRTDADGFAEVRFTPTSTGRIRVVASVTGVSRNAVFFVQGGELASGLVKVSGDSQNGTQGEALSNPFIVEVQDAEGDPLSDRTVSFHVTAGGGSLSEASVRTGANGRAETLLTLGNQRGVHSVQASVPGVDPVTFTARIEPQILVAAANRPVMYWTDGGMLYRLAEKVEHIAVSLENATSWAIGGNKLYWTMTNATNPNRGTLNSANLDGSNATELNDIYGAPYEIAVDVTKGKLYWTDSLNRIQQSDLSGQNIKNAVRDISGLGTLAVAAGNVYWTEAAGRIRSANINGGTPVTPTLASGLGEVLSLAVGGNKLYWLERASNGSGKLQRANLDGTGVEVLKSFATLYDNSLSVDTTRQHLYLAGSGKVSRRNLTGTGYQVVVSGLGNPMSIAIGGEAPAGTSTQTPTTTTTTTPTTSASKYDINADGSVDSKDIDVLIVAILAELTDDKYDVNDDGKVDVSDVKAVNANLDAGAAGAPTLLGTKLTAVEVDRLQEQIDLLIATEDRSPAAMRTLVYLQQLIVMARPEKTQLLANYPNPFNPETWIPYELATDTDVRITIYSAQGVVIRTLQLGQQSAGYYTDRQRAAYWDGRNALGEQVASGIYFYQLETDEMSTLRKMVILK